MEAQAERFGTLVLLPCWFVDRAGGWMSAPSVNTNLTWSNGHPTAKHRPDVARCMPHDPGCIPSCTAPRRKNGTSWKKSLFESTHWYGSPRTCYRQVVQWIVLDLHAGAWSSPLGRNPERSASEASYGNDYFSLLLDWSVIVKKSR